MKIIQYTHGITTDLEKRMEEHFSKNEKCAKYTKTHRAQKLEACFISNSRKTASQLEYRIKKLKKEQKEEMIKSRGTKLLKELLQDKVEDIKNVKRVKKDIIKNFIK